MHAPAIEDVMVDGSSLLLILPIQNPPKPFSLACYGMLPVATPLFIVYISGTPALSWLSNLTCGFTPQLALMHYISEQIGQIFPLHLSRGTRDGGYLRGGGE